MRRRAAVAVVGLALLGGCRPQPEPAARPLIVLIGDSTTAGWGGAAGYVVADTPPLAALTAFLPAASPWRGAEVVNLGVPNSTTHEWAVATTPCPSAPALDTDAPAWTRLGARACAHGAPMVAEVAAVVGRPIDLALVVLGTNDPYRDPTATPAQALANLRTIAAALAPARVLVASPFQTTHPARGAFVDALAAALADAGLLTGPDFARMRLPLDASRVHLTYGGFVAAAALWLDALPATP
jgi:lysophospholipase L1-like esterase